MSSWLLCQNCLLNQHFVLYTVHNCSQFTTYTIFEQSSRSVTSVAGRFKMMLLKPFKQEEVAGKTIHFVSCWGFGSSLRRSSEDSFNAICPGQMLSLPFVPQWSFLPPNVSCKICRCCIRPPDQGQMWGGRFVCVCAPACVFSFNPPPPWLCLWCEPGTCGYEKV